LGGVIVHKKEREDDSCEKAEKEDVGKKVGTRKFDAIGKGNFHLLRLNVLSISGDIGDQKETKGA